MWLVILFSLPVLALDERRNGPCWEETRPADPTGCLAQLEKTIIRTKAEKTPHNKKQNELEVKLLEVDKKRLEKQVKEKTLNRRRAVQRQERDNQAEGNADIFCPDGQDVRIYNNGHLLYSRWQAFNRVTVINTYPFPLRISAVDPNRQKSGQILDLPAGCTVTLSRSIVPFLETGFGGIRFSYIAQPVDGSAAPKLARSQEFYLYGGNSYQQMNTSVWEIRFY
ncbi:MAG: hypothetical protein ACYCZW_02545 [Minisyncoccota bacterium]